VKGLFGQLNSRNSGFYLLENNIILGPEPENIDNASFFHIFQETEV